MSIHPMIVSFYKRISQLEDSALAEDLMNPLLHLIAPTFISAYLNYTNQCRDTIMYEVGGGSIPIAEGTAASLHRELYKEQKINTNKIETILETELLDPKDIITSSINNNKLRW